MTKFKNPITITLLISFFFISTCTNTDSITGNTDSSIGKTSSIADINRTSSFEGTNPNENELADIIDRIFNSIADKNKEVVGGCMLIWFLATTYFSGGDEHHDDDHNDNILSKQYDFRDNYLVKSDKGNTYTACYYLLSKYGIENNLVNVYYKEHYELLKTGIEVANDLQYGSNTNKIIINKKISDDLKDILKVYRDSPNFKEIEPVLEYLEMDLDKYYNKPKFEIAADFE